MLIITTVFPRELLLNFAFQIAQLVEKGGQTIMLRVPVYSGVLKHYFGLNFGYDDGQTCRFSNCKVSIRFDSLKVGCETAARFMLGVYSLRNLVFLLVRPTYPPADNPGAEIRWG